MAHGPGGTATASATVVVSVILSFDVSPTVIGSGQTADLTYDAPTGTLSTVAFSCSPVTPTISLVTLAPTHGEFLITGTAPTTCHLTLTSSDGAHTSTEVRTLTVQ